MISMFGECLPKHNRTHNLKIRLMNEGRCDERLKVELRSLHVSHTLGSTTKQTRNT